MKSTRILMGMPVTVEIADGRAIQAEINKIFDYFAYIDEKFSTYKETSEIMAINRGNMERGTWSEDMQTIFRLAEETKRLTDGYFDIKRKSNQGAKDLGKDWIGDFYDPSGIVKGWAIWQAAQILERDGFKNFYVDAGGDIEIRGRQRTENGTWGKWTIGIRNPFKQDEIVKKICLTDCGIATSGTYIRGDHIYNPKEKTGNRKLEAGNPPVVSLTVIGPNVYEADRFATAAFAMGAAGIGFIEQLPGFEGYMIDREGIATMTSGFGRHAE
ncbi:MAG: FAD:protein FMN transferase [Patescibacteria group bacterium]|nr:FAD:protein FMN transferase [Patescibacteria group bacterium]